MQNEAQGENQQTEQQTGAGRTRTDAVRAQRPGQRRPAASVRTGVSVMKKLLLCSCPVVCVRFERISYLLLLAGFDLIMLLSLLVSI